jgi:hypothetical protein
VTTWETWRAYYPEDGETADDAIMLEALDADDAADKACENDYNNRDGWERQVSQEFRITVISPEGQEFQFNGMHEPSITHIARPIDE